MERIHSLIDRLLEQKKENASAEQLLLTVQLLHSELVHLQKTSLGTSRVAVTMPVNMANQRVSPAPPKIEKAIEPKKEEPAPVKVEVKEVQPQKPVEEVKEISIPKEHMPYAIKKPIPAEPVMKEAEKEPYSPFAMETAVPTLIQHNAKELNEAMAQKTESLNDRLRVSKSELAEALKESPIKDLRKGVGINDRFTFVNELFRGDDPMYERSIKTINSFNILSEAEYWISRELKTKLGWNDTSETVQHFYSLVRRRFS